MTNVSRGLSRSGLSGKSEGRVSGIQQTIRRQFKGSKKWQIRGRKHLRVVDGSAGEMTGTVDCTNRAGAVSSPLRMSSLFDIGEVRLSAPSARRRTPHAISSSVVESKSSRHGSASGVRKDGASSLA